MKKDEIESKSAEEDRKKSEKLDLLLCFPDELELYLHFPEDYPCPAYFI